MKNYKCKDIRNVALAGQGGSGKTTLAEAVLHKCGAIERAGRVADGNTTSDFDAEEIKRKISVNSSLLSAEWKNVKLNIIDAPGQFDFSAGMFEAIRAAETVIIALSAKDGVQAGTIISYNEAKKQKKSVVFAVTKAEEENSNFYKTLEQLKTLFGPSVCPIVVPFDKNGPVECYINLLEMKAFKYDKDGNPAEVEIPASENRIKGLKAAVAESVAETNEELMLRYFENEGSDFTEAELIKGIHDGVDDGKIYPVVCCSAEPAAAIDKLLDTIIYMTPSPNETPGETTASGKVKYDETKPFSGFVFKTVADPFVGKMSFVKVAAGKLTAKTEPINLRTGETERIGKLITLKGKKQDEISEAVAGDIAVITKINAVTNDSLGSIGESTEYTAIAFPEPCCFKAVTAKGKADESKISAAIAKILEEDPTLSYRNDAETHLRILGGTGEQHLETAVQKMKNKFGAEVGLAEPVIAYRETIRKKVSAEGKYKKQSGGHGQYGHVKIEFEPHTQGDSLIFEERVFGGSVPKNYFPAVEKGLQESIPHGVLAGYPVVRLKATLFDGSYHPVDSSELAFKLAANIAFKEGLKKASPCLLEPIDELRITAPEANTGDIMGLLNKRRGSVLGMTPVSDGMTEITAEAPRAETSDFSALIRQITHGLGSFRIRFARYELLPPNLEAEVTANAPAHNSAV